YRAEAGVGRAAEEHQDQTVARDGQSGNRRTLLDRQTARSRDLAERASSCGLGRQCLAPRRDEHNQRPFAADFSEPQDVNAAIIGFGFNVAIVGSVPLIDHFDDANPALAPIKTSRRRSEIVYLGLDLNAHKVGPSANPIERTGWFSL